MRVRQQVDENVLTDKYDLNIITHISPERFSSSQPAGGTVEHRTHIVENEVRSDEEVEAFARHLHTTIVRSPAVVEL